MKKKIWLKIKSFWKNVLILFGLFFVELTNCQNNALEAEGKCESEKKGIIKSIFELIYISN